VTELKANYSLVSQLQTQLLAGMEEWVLQKLMQILILDLIKALWITTNSMELLKMILSKNYINNCMVYRFDYKESKIIQWRFGWYEG
jgi:hypothetical protein